MTDKATLEKLFEAALRGNADFTGRPLRRAFPEPGLSSAQSVQRRNARPEMLPAPQPVRAGREVPGRL